MIDKRTANGIYRENSRFLYGKILYYVHVRHRRHYDVDNTHDVYTHRIFVYIRIYIVIILYICIRFR